MLAANGMQHKFLYGHIFSAPNLTVEPPAHAELKNSVPPGAGREPSQVLRTYSEITRKAIAVPGKERINNQWIPLNQILTRVTIQRTNS